MKKITATFIIALMGSLSLSAQQFFIVKNNNGATLGYSGNSGVKILSAGGLKFKDLNRNGKLDRYEDWRLSVEERAKDLASKMTVEQIAGLMLYSRHQALPAGVAGYNMGTYNGKVFQIAKRKHQI